MNFYEVIQILNYLDHNNHRVQFEDWYTRQKSFQIPLCHCNMLVWQVLPLPVHPYKTFRYMRPGTRLD